MTRFIVGPNDWNFRDAYQQASDGDMLELQDNARVDLGSSVFQINKSLEIVGQMTPTKDLLVISTEQLLLPTKLRLLYAG